MPSSVIRVAQSAARSLVLLSAWAGSSPAAARRLSAKVSQALGRIRRQLSSGSGGAAGSAIRELLASGLSLEKISLSVLSAAMAEAEKLAEDEGAANAFARAGGIKAKIAESLASQDLPLSKKNIEAIESAYEKIPDKLSDGQIAEVLRSEKKADLELIYIGRHTNAPEANADGAGFAELAAEIERFASREGIEMNGENLGVIKFLVMNGLPVSRGNMELVFFLRDIETNLDIDSFIKAAASLLREGKSPMSTVLYPPSTDQADAYEKLRGKYEGVLETFYGVMPEKIDALMQSRVFISIGNLVKGNPAPDERGEAVGDGVYESPAAYKRQLAELQLKLTREAAVRLAGKNVDINEMPLRQALDELRKADAEPYSKVLTEAGAEVKETGTISELFAKIDGFRPLTCNVFGDILRLRADFTVNGVYGSLERARNALADIEAFGTAPNKRFGDSFEKVRGQFAEYLSAKEIAASDANCRAAAILSKNGMEIDYANITEVKTIDGKINEIIDTLHPRIAAAMIREGLNPLNMHADDMLNYIRAFNDEYGRNLTERIAECIFEMDRRKETDPETRESVVAVYRMLNVIRKNESFAIGAALKAGSELTLGDLMEAGKYLERTGGGARSDKDIVVDENFGFLDKSEAPEGNIRRILYNSELIHRFAGSASPETLEGLFARNPDWKSDWLEDVFEEGAQRQATEYSVNLALEQNARLGEVSPETVYWMEQNRMPVTIANVLAMNGFVKKQFYLGEKLDELNETHKIEEEIMDAGLESLRGPDAYGALNPISERLKRLAGDPDPLLKELSLIQNAVKVQDLINRRGNGASLQAPVRINGKITGLNLYVLNGKKLGETGAKIFMSLSTRELGVIQAYFTAEQGADIRVNADRPEAVEFIRERLGLLSEILLGEGVVPGKVTAGMEGPVNMLADESEKVSANKNIYNGYEVYA